jgi:hypothetical protein
MNRREELITRKEAIEAAILKVETEDRRWEALEQLDSVGIVINADEWGQKELFDYLQREKDFLESWLALLDDPFYINAEVFMDPETSDVQRIAAGEYLLSRIWKNSTFSASKNNPNAVDAWKKLKREIGREEFKKHALTALFLSIADGRIPRDFKVGKHGRTKRGRAYVNLKWIDTVEKIRSETRSNYDALLIERAYPRLTRPSLLPGYSQRIYKTKKDQLKKEKEPDDSKFDALRRETTAKSIDILDAIDFQARTREHALGFIDPNPIGSANDRLQKFQKGLKPVERTLVTAVSDEIRSLDIQKTVHQGMIQFLFDKAGIQFDSGRRREGLPHNIWKKIEAANRSPFPLFLPRFDKSGRDLLQDVNEWVMTDPEFVGVFRLVTHDIIVRDARKIRRSKNVDPWVKTILMPEEEERTSQLCGQINQLAEFSEEQIIERAITIMGITPGSKDDTLYRLRKKYKPRLREFVGHDGTYGDPQREEYRTIARNTAKNSGQKWSETNSLYSPSVYLPKESAVFTPLKATYQTTVSGKSEDYRFRGWIWEPPRWIDLKQQGMDFISMESLIRYRVSAGKYKYTESRCQTFYKDKQPTKRPACNYLGLHGNLLKTVLVKAMPSPEHRQRKIYGRDGRLMFTIERHLLDTPFPPDRELAELFGLRVETIREVIFEAYHSSPPFMGPDEQADTGKTTVEWNGRVNWEPGSVTIANDRIKWLPRAENPLIQNWNAKKKQEGEALLHPPLFKVKQPKVKKSSK